MNGFLIAAIVCGIPGILCCLNPNWSPLGAILVVVAIVCGWVGGVKRHDERKAVSAHVERVARATFTSLKHIRVEEGGSVMTFDAGSGTVSVPCEVTVKFKHGRVIAETATPDPYEKLSATCTKALLAATSK